MLNVYEGDLGGRVFVAKDVDDRGPGIGLAEPREQFPRERSVDAAREDRLAVAGRDGSRSRCGAGTGQGLLCDDLYGQPRVFSAHGLQPERVVSTDRWSAFPPGWICEFWAYQSDLLVIREPANWRAWAAVAAVLFLTVGVAWLLP